MAPTAKDFEELNCRLEVIQEQRNVALRDHAIASAKLKMANARIEELEKNATTATSNLVA